MADATDATDATIATARGDTIPPRDLGFTLITEHVFHPTAEVDLNWPHASFGGQAREAERIDDAVEKLEYAKSIGVDTIVDRSIPGGTGRFVPRVKKVAERTSVNVIVATGWYTWHDLPPFFTFRERYKGSLSGHVDTLEDFFVRDIEDGIADTGVRAGIIKCVTDRYGLTEDVRTAIRAAAGAHRRTGVPITTHTGIGIGLESGRLQIQALTEDGVDVSRVNIGHIDFTPPEVPVEEFEEFLQHGSFISFDAVALKNQFPDDVNEARLHRVVELSARGYAPQIMLSNGDSIYDDLLPQEYYDRTHPFPVFSELSLNFIPALLERGVSKADIDLMTRENPRRYFETTAMGSY